MVKGTRYYYDRHGRYRGKNSQFGPVTQAFWKLVIVGLGALLALGWLEENWKKFGWVFPAICTALILIRMAVLLSKGRPIFWWSWLLAAAISLTIGFFEVDPILAALRL